ncbi:MAG: efflux transporter outer membrane subunit [Bryobacteraceae bacterium]|nr:efflux transporter outer membrane subunit [Bryobacteraceae bacterium]
MTSAQTITRSAVAASLLVALTGCALGPNYKRPQIALPADFRGTVPPTDQSTSDPKSSLADTKWPEVFREQTLQKLVDTALTNNFNIRIAAERIQQARAQLGVTRADLFPFLDIQGSFTGTRQSTLGSFRFIQPGTNLAVSYTQAGAALSWELDIWGRLRRLTEAARAEYFATVEGQRTVITSLVSDVTTAYFQLLELELELDISRKTRDLATDSVRLVGFRRDQGAASGLDLRQAEQLLYTAGAQIEAVERSIAQTENLLSLLLGQAPSQQPRGSKLTEILMPPEVPAGLPSAILERRPDIRAAEQSLIAANARIGAARALYFPNLSLTAFAGAQTRALTEIASNPARQYSIVPATTLPIFRAGQIRNQVRLSESQQRELLVAYQQTIYTALREVADSLAAYSNTRDQRAQQQLFVRTLEDTVRLSTLRYKGGLDSYLQVLDSQRNLFSGELDLARLQLQERLTVVQLYRALGGGWQ